MLSTQCLFLTAIITGLIWAEDPSNSEDKDKLVLNPAQLIDLILDERLKSKGVDSKPQDTTAISIKSNDDDVLDKRVVATESTDDLETLRSRKVWSRWSKWGPCSVSCGIGVITRRRACVAGRCARGEREEQRRLCHLTPCAEHESNDLE